MLQATLSGTWDLLTTAATLPTSKLAPTTVSTGGRQPAPASALTCGYGYVSNQGLCMSQGCIDGKSMCAVMDGYGRTCSYDQLMAFQSQTGIPACAPAPALPLPTVPEITPPLAPEITVDVSPNPGTQIVATATPDQLVPPGYKQPGIPRWALALGGLALLSIVVALLVRR